jgi:hypothetical protein
MRKTLLRAVASHPRSLLYKKKSIADTNAIAIATKNTVSSTRPIGSVPITFSKFIAHRADALVQMATTVLRYAHNSHACAR